MLGVEAGACEHKRSGVSNCSSWLQMVADGEERLFVSLPAKSAEISWPPGRTSEFFDGSLTYIPGSTVLYGVPFRMLSNTISFTNHLA